MALNCTELLEEWRIPVWSSGFWALRFAGITGGLLQDMLIEGAATGLMSQWIYDFRPTAYDISFDQPTDALALLGDDAGRPLYPDESPYQSLKPRLRAKWSFWTGSPKAGLLTELQAAGIGDQTPPTADLHGLSLVSPGTAGTRSFGQQIVVGPWPLTITAIRLNYAAGSGAGTYVVGLASAVGSNPSDIVFLADSGIVSNPGVAGPVTHALTAPVILQPNTTYYVAARWASGASTGGVTGLNRSTTPGSSLTGAYVAKGASTVASTANNTTTAWIVTNATVYDATLIGQPGPLGLSVPRDYSSPLDSHVDYWSRFWLHFAAFAHPITGPGKTWLFLELGADQYGPEGLTADYHATLRAIVRRNKPAQWVPWEYWFDLPAGGRIALQGRVNPLDPDYVYYQP